MKIDTFTLGLANKGRLAEKSLKYLKKRNLKIIYNKNKRSLSGKIKGMENVSVNLLHARSVIDLLSQNIISVGISGLDLLADENATIYNNVVLEDKNSGYLKADLIKYDFESKKYKISMFDNRKKIKAKLIE